MRFLACALILLGGIGFFDAIKDDRRGVASAFAPTRTPILEVASRADAPELFAGLMAYQWMRASLAVCAGLVILGMCRRLGRCDPFSPTFTGRDVLDECEHKLDAELRKKHSPLR
jgi:hypothetical protein